jgi:hypothetical protein
VICGPPHRIVIPPEPPQGHRDPLGPRPTHPHHGHHWLGRPGPGINQAA